MLFLNPFSPQIMYLDVYVPVFKTACSELTEADHPCTSASAAAWLEAWSWRDGKMFTSPKEWKQSVQTYCLCCPPNPSMSMSTKHGESCQRDRHGEMMYMYLVAIGSVAIGSTQWTCRCVVSPPPSPSRLSFSITFCFKLEADTYTLRASPVCVHIKLPMLHWHYFCIEPSRSCPVWIVAMPRGQLKRRNKVKERFSVVHVHMLWRVEI